MGESMSIFVIFSSEAFMVIITGYDRALFWTFRLVRQHVRLEVLEDSSTIRIRAAPFLVVLVIQLETTGPLAV